MEKILRQLMIWICAPIYKLIPTIYEIFYKLANHRFFEDDTIEKLSSNIYVLVSVVMLFAFSANLLASIVNPDLINDKKKGVGAVFKRAIIGLMLIILIPFGFDKAYEIQQEVMDKSLIEKVLVGISYKDDENKGGNGGQVIAGTLINSVLHPKKDDIEISEDVQEDYTEMVTEDIEKIDDVADNINIAPSDGSYKFAFDFEYLVALIAGGVCLYLLLIFAFDMAVRSVKLAFLELTAPISIVAYIAVGEDMLKKWFEELSKTFLDVFMRIACMAFYIFMIANIDGFIIRVNGNWFVKVLLLVGILIFVKQLPDLIGKIFKVKIESKGGIGGRLGSMAAVGNVAKKSWDTVSKGLKTVGLTAAGAGAAVGTLGLPGAIGAGVGVGFAHHGWNKGFKNNLLSKITGHDLSTRAGKDTATGTALRRAGAFLGAGNPIAGVGAAKKVERNRDTLFDKKREQRKDEKLQNKIGIDETGSLNQNTISAAQSAVDNLNSIVSASHISNNAKNILNRKFELDRENNIMQKLKGANDEIKDLLSTAASNSKTPEAMNKIENLKQSFTSGNESMSSLTQKLNDMVTDGTLSEGSAKSIVSQINKIDSISQSKEFNKINGDEHILMDENGKIKSVMIGVQAKKAEERTKVVQGKYDDVVASASDREKSEIERLVSAGEDANSEYARKNSEKRGDNYTYSINATSPQTENNSQQIKNDSHQVNINTSELPIDFDKNNEYAQQYNIDDYDIHSNYTSTRDNLSMFGDNRVDNNSNSGPTLNGPTEGPTLNGPTEGPTLNGPTEGPTEGPTLNNVDDRYADVYNEENGQPRSNFKLKDEE